MAASLEDDLASELQAATRDLLDLGRAASPSLAASTGPSQSSRSLFSTGAKIEVLHSPTDIRPIGWLSPHRPTIDTSPTSNKLFVDTESTLATNVRYDDEDDALPSRGLSGRIESVKAGRSHLSPSFSTDTGLPPVNTAEGIDPTSSSPSKLRLSTPVNDIYINEFGERVVNGKVVGKTIGGRPRSTAGMRAGLSQEIPNKVSPVVAAAPRGQSDKSPPAFFLHAFPDTGSPSLAPISVHSDTAIMPRLQAPQAVSRALLSAPPHDNDDDANFDRDVASDPQLRSDTIDDDDVSSSDADPAEEAPQAFTDVSLYTPVEEVTNIMKSVPTSNTLGLTTLRSASATSQISHEETEHVVLHGNNRQARASAVGTKVGNERSSSPFLLPILSRRVEGLFSSPRVTTAATDTQLDRIKDREDDMAHTEPTPDVSAKEDAREDAASLDSASSSLLSLPVSVPSHASGTSSLERRRSIDAGGKSRRRSRRSDQSMYPEDNFARDVRIRGWNEVGSQARGWVVFEILIVTKQGTPITALKRFSSFITLRKQLSSECPDQAKWLPSLPSKRTGILRKYDAKHLEQRRKDLQRWLQVIMLDKVWGCSESLRDWVLASE